MNARQLLQAIDVTPAVNKLALTLITMVNEDASPTADQMTAATKMMMALALKGIEDELEQSWVLMQVATYINSCSHVAPQPIFKGYE